MDADPERQGHCAGDGGGGEPGADRAKGDPHGQPFRNVVQGNGQHEQGRAPPGGFDAFSLRQGEPDVQVGQQFVGPPQAQAAQQEPGGGGEPGWDAVGLGHVNSGRQQRPIAGRDHDAAGKPEQAVEPFAVQVAAQEDAGRAQGGDAPGEAGG